MTISAIAAVLLLATSQGAASTQAADQDSKSIVVTGERVPREEARKQAVEYIRRAGVSELHPVARWTMPICPKVSGVEPKIAAIITERVRETALEAGARVADKGCAANIAIYFTNDGETTANNIHRKSPALFGQMSPDVRDRLLTGTDAIRWWHTTQIASRDGVPAGSAPMPWVKIDGGEGGGSAIGGDNLSHYGSSLVSTQAIRTLSTASIIVDVEKATGYSLDAIASFAAMVALAELDGDPPPPDGSILGLFAKERERRDLSAQDSALLKAIYTMPLDREAGQHRRRLIGALIREGTTSE